MKVFDTAVRATDSEINNYDSLHNITLRPHVGDSEESYVHEGVWWERTGFEGVYNDYMCTDTAVGAFRSFSCSVSSSDSGWRKFIELPGYLQEFLPVGELHYGDIDNDGDDDIAIKLGADIYVFHNISYYDIE